MKNTLCSRLVLSGLCLGWWSQPSVAATGQYLQLTVNSNQDQIQPDEFLTLREALTIVNGQISLNQLSAAERGLVQLSSTDRHQIQFKLTANQSRIVLNAELPAIVKPKVKIDGGQSTTFSMIQNLAFARPAVEITPAPGRQINRGLSLMADDITVTGLSIYGFQVGNAASTQNIPGADIFIGTSNDPNLDNRPAPQRIRIENNWLGIQADRSIPNRTSDFGVYVFNSEGTTIWHNAIGHHSASGIISQVSANNLIVADNAIFGNGQSGMPDAIRLEGNLANNQIQSNLICGNDGSGVFVFKPASGSVKITNNQIQSNGRRLRRAAVHLMGEDHQVSNNSIEFQNGSGVSVTAFSHNNTRASVRNLITNNRFQKIEGLSIDLIADRNGGVAGVEDFQTGDGINPPRNSENRRTDTGNGAINAPRFLAPEFYLINNRVNLDGVADPGTEVEIYQVNPDGSQHGPLSQLLTKVTADNRGNFQATIPSLAAGSSLSAIATDRRYGTSEPAENVLVIQPGVTATTTANYPIPADCALVAPVIAASPVTTPPEQPVPSIPTAPPTLTKISIPRNVHFALDKSAISPMSIPVLTEIVHVLKANPYISIDLAGHTDPRAPQAYNQALGLRRATSIRNYLLRQGISPQRMTIRSLGFSNRRSNERGVQPYALDRRVEFEYRDLRGGELEVIDRLDDLQPER